MEKNTMKSVEQATIRIWIRLLLVIIIPIGEYVYQKFGFTFFESWAIAAIGYLGIRGMVDDLFSLMDLKTLKETIEYLYESVEEEES